MQISDTFQQLPGAPVWQSGTVELICQQVIAQTENVSTFVFQTSPPGRFHYKPGQFVTLQIELDGERVSRSYTMSSSPSRPYSLELTIKRVEGGRMSGRLLDHFKAGDSVRATGPGGGFNIIDLPARQLLFLSSSCGITPMMSMSRWLLDTHAEVDIHFIHCGATADDLLFVSELEAMAKTYRHFNVEFVVEEKEGYLDKKRLNQSVTDLHQRTTYVCGSPEFMKAVKAMLSECGYDMSRYHYEQFTADRVDAELEQETTEGANEPYQISFRTTGQQVTAYSDNSVLDILEGQGAPVIAACRQGICGSCKVQILEGEVASTSQVALTPEEIDQGFVLSCCSTPKSDLSIDI